MKLYRIAYIWQKNVENDESFETSIYSEAFAEAKLQLSSNDELKGVLIFSNQGTSVVVKSTHTNPNHKF